MSKYARGNNAHGFCDVCGFRCMLRELRVQVVAGKPTQIKACPTCDDPDHPQNHVGRLRVLDPQALQDPRPDPALAASRDEPPPIIT